ncbi:hypothetical protein ACG02S_14985 [Roseateles sp. DC23W]|uniref:Uncharacterized protein n=1 Tax=Pelomonas dachongensis TaxID=3299029 RepID=A0ABW7ENZ9_9BURK
MRIARGADTGLAGDLLLRGFQRVDKAQRGIGSTFAEQVVQRLLDILQRPGAEDDWQRHLRLGAWTRWRRLAKNAGRHFRRRRRLRAIQQQRARCLALLVATDQVANILAAAAVTFLADPLLHEGSHRLGQ